MKKGKNLSGARFYIALSCCVLVIALVGYVGRFANQKSETPDKKVSEIVQVDDAKTPIPTQPPAPVKTPAPAAEKAPDKAQQKTKAVAKTVNAEESTPTPAKTEKPSFSAPLAGTLAEGFSGDNLIYNTVLGDWRTHDGVDISAQAGTEVKAASDGTVTKLFESALGVSVTIEHKNGYTTVYAGLADTDMVKEGQEIKTGDTLGKLAEKSTGENVKEPHLHFEILQNGENINPADFISFAN